jgi:phosphoglycerate dehydrogenase-like enzyme
MLPHCDVVLIAAGLGSETRGLINGRRLALLDPTALLINIGRAAIVDGEALYRALSGNQLGGAALDVWWQHWSPEYPNRRPARFPFQDLSNGLMTPHCSGFTEGTADRRWGDLAANLDRYIRGDDLQNIVLRTWATRSDTNCGPPAEWGRLARVAVVGEWHLTVSVSQGLNDCPQ